MPGVVTVDVGGVQEWISAGATELKVVRGGSLLLEATFREALEVLEGEQGCAAVDAGALDAGKERSWTVPVRSSGALTAVFAAEEDAHRAVGPLRGLVQQRLPGLPVQVGSAAVADPTSRRADEQGVTPFQAAVAAARRAGGHQQEDVAARPPPVVPGGRLCATCGQGTADPSVRGTDRGAVCPACSQRLRLSVGEEASPPGTRVATEFREIGAATAAPRFRGYMAVIAADGNAVGRRFMDKGTPAELAAESRTVSEDVDAAVSAALQAAAEAAGSDRVVPYNPVIRAGDDVCLVVPADVGMRAGAALCTARAGLSVSAGVVVCHDSLPFSLARETAEGLLAEAKRAGRSVGDERQPVPHVALRVESGSAPGEDPVETLTASPYPAALVGQLADAAAAVPLAGAAAHNLAEELLASRRVGQRAWALYKLAVLEPQQRQVVRELFDALGVGDEDEPWLDAPSEAPRTPLGDLILLGQLEA